MKHVLKFWFVSVTISLVIFFVSGVFCGIIAASEKPKVVRIALIGDLSGPYAAIGVGTHESIIDGCEYVNKALGGIRGVPIEAVVRDTGGKVDVAISHYMEVREMKPKPFIVMTMVDYLQL